MFKFTDPSLNAQDLHNPDIQVLSDATQNNEQAVLENVNTETLTPTIESLEQNVDASSETLNSLDLGQSTSSVVESTVASTLSPKEKKEGYWQSVQLPVLTMDEFRKKREQTLDITNLNTASIPSSTPLQTRMTAMRIGGDGSPMSPASLTEMARALQYNPDNIYEYVKNNIEYTPGYEGNRGALGALLDNQGNSIDQSMLMVELLRLSGYEANYVDGLITLNAQQLKDLFGFSAANTCSLVDFFSATQIPVDKINNTTPPVVGCNTNVAVTSATFAHTWVQTKINGTNYVFDPSFKNYTTKAAIDLKTAMGYDKTTLLANAKVGATITNDYVQNINRTNIRNTLNTYSGNLIQYLRANKPAATIDDVLGGKQLNEVMSIARDTSFETANPVRKASYTYPNMPVSAKSVLRVKYQGIDQAFTSDFLYGKRLTITFNTSNQPELRLDGVIYGAAGTAIAPGTQSTATLSAIHNLSTALSGEMTANIKAGGTFVIANGWGYSSRGLTSQFRNKLDKARAAGIAENSEEIKGLTLAFTGAQWLSQSSAAAYTLAKLRNSYMQPYHQLGIVGYINSGATYVDFPMVSYAVAGPYATLLDRNQNIGIINESINKVMSVLESTTVQQVTGAPAASTVTVLDSVLGSTQKLFAAKANNFTTTVKPNLISCSAGQLATYNNYINSGWLLLLPQNCQQNKGIWSGDAYFGSKLVGSMSYAMAKIGAFAGGQTSVNRTTSELGFSIQNQNASSGDWNISTGQSYSDPIDLTKGSFLLEHEDLHVGTGSGLQSLGFSRLYSSDNSTQNGVLGKGWDHNYNQELTIGSDGFQGMGEDSALDAVGMLVASHVILDMTADATRPLDAEAIKIISASWLGEQLVDNTAIVQQGLNGGVYVKLPDGSYNPPPGNASKLIRNANGTYTLDSVNHAKAQFNVATGTAATKGKIISYTEPSGLQVKFNYNTAGQLSSVSNSLGRVLTLNYTNNKISSVTDGSRTINYVYDANGNLTSYKNTLGQATTYQYDVPGRMIKIFYPSFPSSAAVSNVYDSLGRVKEQTNALGKTYYYGFAGSRSFEISPEITKADGTKEKQEHVNYVNAMGQITWEKDPLGRWRQRIYDGQSRVIKQIEPEGNSVEYSYDDASCNSTEKRCTHNIKTIKNNPKAGSGLAVITQSMTYDPVTNQIASATDGRGNTTNYAYNTNGTLSKVSLAADNAGVRPETSYSYVSYTPTGYPTLSLLSSVSNKINATNTTTTTTTYNASNKYVPSTTVVDAGTGKLNLTTTLTYDAIGNLIKVDGPRTDVTDTVTTAYNTERLATQSTDGLGKITKNYYDADGRVIRTAAQLGTQWMVSCNSYSTSGKLTRSWGPVLQATDASCPAATSPTQVTDITYDEVDRQSKITEYPSTLAAENRVSQTWYNLDNTVKGIKKAVGTAGLEQYYAQYLYTPNGKLLWSIDALNNGTRNQYDGFDRVKEVAYATAGVGSLSINPNDTETFGYDANGNVTQRKTRSGALINQAYDKLNRLTATSYPTEVASNTTYAYDLLNRRTQSKLSNNSNTVDYVYDNAGRLASTTSGGKVIAYQYDAAGNPIRTTWPETGFYVTRSYDALNRPKDIKETGTVNLASYAYDDLSRRTTVTLGNGTTTTSSYNAQNQQTGLSHALAGTAQDVAYSYTRDRLGNIKTESWNNDLYQWASPAASSTAYVKNGLNQYTSVGGKAQTYDTNGNLKTDGNGWTYSYDLNNRLKTAVKTGTGAITANLNYDAEGRLRQTAIGSTTTDLVYDGTDLVAEYNGATLARRYVHGPGVDEPLVWYEGNGVAAKNWIYTDKLGSVVALANTTGTSTASYSYGPFGEPNTTAGNMRFRYTGQQLIPALNLYYYKARFYSPTLGRFLQTDPIGQADDMNLYAYVKNNAINSIDPKGLSVITTGPQAGMTGLSDTSLSNVDGQGKFSGAGASEYYTPYDPASDRRGKYDLYDPNPLSRKTDIIGIGSGAGLAKGSLPKPYVSDKALSIPSGVRDLDPRGLVSQQTSSEMSGSAIKRYTKSMLEKGYVGEPIHAVVRDDGKIVISDGHHRVEAAKRARLKTVPVEVYNPYTKE